MIQSLHEQTDRMTMISAWVLGNGRAVVNHTTFPDGNITCVVGVHGRGSLQVTESEFDELLGCLVEIDRVRKGGTPTTTEDQTT